MEAYSFILLLALAVSGAFAYSNLRKWYTMLFILGPVMLLLFFIIVVIISNSDSGGPRGDFSLLLFLSIAVIGYLMTIIGFLCYCVKSYTAKKTNQQIEFLNYQIQDQVNILTAQAESSQAN